MSESSPPSRNEGEPRPLSFLFAAMWSLLAIILFQGAAELLDAAHPGARTDIVTYGACRVLATSVVLFLILRVHEPETPIRQVLALRRPPALFTVLAIVAGGAMALPGAWLDEVFLKRFPLKPEEIEALDRLNAAQTPAKHVALVVVAVLVLPICDELFFHGALFTPLKRGRRADWVVVATASYAAILGGADERTLASFLGVFLAIGAIRAMGGSLWPALAARIAFFAVQVAPEAFGRPDFPLTRMTVLSGAGVAALALAAATLVARRSGRAEAARLLDG